MRTIYLDNYDWNIYLYDDVAPNSKHSIETMLFEMGMDSDDIDNVLGVFDKPNRGFVYTNIEARESIIAIGWCTSWKQEINTLAHEILHLAEHICKGHNLPTNGEPPAYIVSDIIGQICD